MCYEFVSTIPKVESTEKQAQPKVVAKYQYKPVISPPEPVHRTSKPEKVQRELIPA